MTRMLGVLEDKLYYQNPFFSLMSTFDILRADNVLRWTLVPK